MNITLYHYWRSSCSWRVRWALAIKGQSYKSVPVNILAAEHQSPAYLARNPSGFLPALEVDGRFYGESLAILEWIDETWPAPSLLPADAFARMQVRQLALTIATGTQPLQNPSLLKYCYTDEERRKDHARHFIARGLGVYEELLGRGQPGKFSWGDQVSMADLCLVPQVYNAQRFGVDLTGLPLITRINAACLQEPACIAAHPSQQPGATSG